MHVVKVDRVFKEYYLGTQKVTALKNVSLLARKGEFLAIAGPSGSGKSTVLNLIGCIDSPTEGSVFIDGEDVTSRTPDELADIRARKIGFIFQTFNLLPVLSAWENVEYPLLIRKDVSRADRLQRVHHYLEVVGLGRFKNHRPNEMSGGQRQRVAIARALAINPSIVLADEPTANLDHDTGLSVLALMKKINKEEKATFIFSTHDAQVIAMADRVVRITDGTIVDAGYKFNTEEAEVNDA